jgi:hypothetical protein
MSINASGKGSSNMEADMDAAENARMNELLMFALRLLLLATHSMLLQLLQLLSLDGHEVSPESHGE